MCGLQRAIRRCLGLGGIFLATMLMAAGLASVLSAVDDKSAATVMRVISLVALLAVLVDAALLLVLVGIVSSRGERPGKETSDEDS
ncbi:MAG: hypothetical protein QF363_17815 [Planctomycetaceae bacterium]|jgi:hypothetical protein|nr:hypothetical protein [Planctomycetaceae bacterium]